MIPTRLEDLAEVVGGTVHDAAPETVVTGAAFLDSRAPIGGGLFAAFAGEQVDGHAYAGQAVAGGAAAVLGSRPTGVPTVVVDDVQVALHRLAHHQLATLRSTSDAQPGRTGLRVVGITGSQGKTTAKDMLAAVLAADAPTVATHGSFNNELGLPLTVLRADETTRWLVLEMGARGIGHIAELCRIAPPDVALVLNVGRAHLGEFGSRDNIALAKGELVEAVGTEGTAVLNADDPRVAAMAERTSGRVFAFGRSAEADLRLSDVVLDELGRPGFALAAGGEVVTVRLQLLGEHQAGNAAAVAAVALALGLRLDAVAVALEQVTRLSPWRMEVHERSDGLVVVNDAYNANPDSMRSALETLADLGRRSGRRTVAVLGEMRELGEHGAAEHAAVGRLASELGIDEVVTIGAAARAIGGATDGATHGGTTRHLDSVSDAITWLRQNVLRTDVVLVKASRGARLERVADALVAEEMVER